MENYQKKINYITHDSWWNSDLPLFKEISKFFQIDVFVFSSKYHTKHFPIKESEYVNQIYEVERPYKLKDVRSFSSAFKFASLIKRNCKTGDTNVYVFGDDFYFNILFIFLFGVKNSVISMHNFTPHSDSPFHERVFKVIYLKLFRSFHFQSRSQYLLFKEKFPKKKCFYTEMPMKDFGSPTLPRLTGPKSPTTFLFFGLIRDYKRLDLFIKAANSITANAHFIIAGNCKNWADYEKLIYDKEKFTTNIAFIDNAEIPNLFTMVDFLVLPYSDTTQSGPLLIAYQYRLPLIVSDLSMFTELVKDSYNGYVFKQGDFNSLAEKINQAINLPLTEYQKMKANQEVLSAAYEKSSSTIGDTFSKFIAKI